MSQVITTRNNKQSGGTYVSIRQSQSDGSISEFIKSEDNAINFKTLLEECAFIGCINASSVNSIIFYGYSSTEGKIVLGNEKEPDKKTYNFCIKVSFIKTDKTLAGSNSLDINFKDSTSEYTFDKNIKTDKEVTDEGVAQKEMFDSLQLDVSNYIIPDIIAMGRMTPDEFKQITEKCFDSNFRGWRNPEELKKLNDKFIVTVSVVQSIIEEAKKHDLDLGVTFMDYESGIHFETYVEKHCPFTEELRNTQIKSVIGFHDVGYYKDVYKIVEIVEYERRFDH